MTDERITGGLPTRGEEPADDRRVRRWREQNVIANPPCNITQEESDYARSQMIGWLPWPYVESREDDVFPSDPHLLPWERLDWDPVAAMVRGYKVPLEGSIPTAVAVSADDIHTIELQQDAWMPSPAPEKTDPSWSEPSLADKARLTPLVVSGWSHEKIAYHLEISVEELRWGYHDTLQRAGLALEARFATDTLKNALTAPGPDRRRVMDYMRVFKDPRPAATKAPVVRGASRNAGAQQAQKSVAPASGHRGRLGGPPPRPDADGVIGFTLFLGDGVMRAQNDADTQRQATMYQHVLEFRAARAGGAPH